MNVKNFETISSEFPNTISYINNPYSGLQIELPNNTIKDNLCGVITLTKSRYVQNIARINGYHVTLISDHLTEISLFTLPVF